MALGRPRLAGTDEERAQRRRERVLRNVRAHRQRRKIAQQNAVPQECVVARKHPVENVHAQEFLQGRDMTLIIPSFEGAVTLDTCDLQICPPDKNDSFGWTLQLPLRIRLSSAYREAFISEFNRRCQVLSILPSDSSQDAIRINVFCGSWVDKACIDALSTPNGLLSDALLAVSLIVMGQIRADPSLLQGSMSAHSRVLHKLRWALARLDSLSTSKNRVSLISVSMFVALTELLYQRSWAQFALHIRGIGAVIEAAGPSALEDLAARQQFLGYRSVQMSFALVERRASFLAQEQWSALPWIEDTSCQSLFTLAYAIPGEMEALDSQPTASLQALQSQLQRLQQIASQLEEWQVRYFGAEPWIVCPSRQSDSIIEPGDFREIAFADLTAANSLTLYAGIRVALHSLGAEAAQLIDAGQGQTASIAYRSHLDDACCWAVRACRGLQYFVLNEPFGLGKIACLLPLDMAWMAFKALGTRHGINCEKEIAWCHRLAQDFERTGLPVMRYH